MPFMNIAHRGFSSQYPENTLLSFQKALDLGVTYVEFDLQITRDGHLVVIHDRTVDRTTNSSGQVSDLSLARIKALDAGIRFAPQFAGQRIPTFEETLDLLAGCAKMAVELKFESREPISQVINTLKQRDLIDQVSISSFDLSKLPEVKSLCPECSTTALVSPASDPKKDWIALMCDLGIDVFGPRHTDTTQELIDQAHAKGLLVRCWGLGRDQGPGLERLIDLGANGATTDCPDILQAILRRRNLL